MRLLFFSAIPNSSNSGMGNWTHSLALVLREQGHQVELWFEDAVPVSKRLGRVSVLTHPAMLAQKLIQRRREFDVAVVHEPSGFWYGLARRVNPALPPMVLMCHNVESKCFGVMKAAAKRGMAHVPASSLLKTPLLRLWQSDTAAGLADHVVCLSSEDRDYLVGSLGVPAEKISLMLNGFESTSPLNRHRRPDSVLFVGGWLDVKGRRVLVPCWSELAKRNPRCSMTLVGTGAKQEDVLSEFPAELRGRIRVVPRVESREEMRHFYAEHSVFLMPSLSEGSPLSLVEAMNGGAAVVASRVGGIPDLVEEGTSALLFDSMDWLGAARHIEALFSDDALRARLVRSAAVRAQELTWHRTTAVALDAAHKALISSGRPGGVQADETTRSAEISSSIPKE